MFGLAFALLILANPHTSLGRVAAGHYSACVMRHLQQQTRRRSRRERSGGRPVRIKMAEKSLPDDDLSSPARQLEHGNREAASPNRRAFVRRAVAVGIPVVIATVRGRSVHAQSLSGCGSLQPSGCVATEGLVPGENLVEPAKVKPGKGLGRKP